MERTYLVVIPIYDGFLIIVLKHEYVEQRERF